MTDKEIAEALRNCAKQTDCMLCGLYNHGDCYPERKLKIAADSIERLLQKNAELRRQLKNAMRDMQNESACWQCQLNGKCHDEPKLIPNVECGNFKWRGAQEVEK